MVGRTHLHFGPQLLVVSNQYQLLCLWGEAGQDVALQHLSCLLHHHDLLTEGAEQSRAGKVGGRGGALQVKMGMPEGQELPGT